MPQRYDVSYAKVEDGNTNWVKIGVAFASGNPKKPDRIRIRLDALPLPGLWDNSLVLFPKED